MRDECAVDVVEIVKKTARLAMCIFLQGWLVVSSKWCMQNLILFLCCTQSPFGMRMRTGKASCRILFEGSRIEL